MKNKKWLLFAVSVALIGGTAGALNWLKAHQRLGVPGIKATAIPGEVTMHIALPEHVLDCTSEYLPQADVVLGWLPRDTSYAQRRYIAPDGFWASANIILMGMDRSSIHTPDICLPGQGWKIMTKTDISIPISGRQPLTVAKWVVRRFRESDKGEKVEERGLLVFWLVAQNEQTASHSKFKWWIMWDMLSTGVLQRWAYVSYFSACAPDQEEVTFQRMEQLIAASVPEFQLPSEADTASAVAKQ